MTPSATLASNVRIPTLALLTILLGAACSDAQRAVISGLKSYSFPTTSMEPTIRNGEHAFATPYRSTPNPKRGDVVVFRYPLNPKIFFGKRVVAIPGDRVEIRDKQLYVNGAAVAEPYVRHDDPTIYQNVAAMPEPYRSRDQFGPVVLQADQFFVLGDNREHSSDSRYWGPLPRANIVARIVKAGSWTGTLRTIE